ncbi:MAG: hypothetical protein ABI851_05760 [Saprospiraceae bacterium]
MNNYKIFLVQSQLICTQFLSSQKYDFNWVFGYDGGKGDNRFGTTIVEFNDSFYNFRIDAYFTHLNLSKIDSSLFTTINYFPNSEYDSCADNSYVAFANINLFTGECKILAEYRKCKGIVGKLSISPNQLDSNIFLVNRIESYLKNDTNIKESFYETLFTDDNWNSFRVLKLDLPFNNYFLTAITKIDSYYILAGRSDTKINSNAFIAKFNKNFKRIDLYSINEPININSINPKSNTLFYLSGYIYYHHVNDPITTNSIVIWNSELNKSKNVKKDTVYNDYMMFYFSKITKSINFQSIGQFDIGINTITKSNYINDKYFGFIEKKSQSNNIEFRRNYCLGHRTYFSNIEFYLGNLYVIGIVDSLVRVEFTRFAFVSILDPSNGNILSIKYIYLGNTSSILVNSYFKNNKIFLCGGGNSGLFENTSKQFINPWLHVINLDELLITIDNEISNNQYSLNKGIRIYPNPITNYFYVDNMDCNEIINGNFEIFNYLGFSIYKSRELKCKNYISDLGIKNGILKLRSNHEYTTIKVYFNN